MASLFFCNTDYETRDGTPIRDYIHVVDVARGCVWQSSSTSIASSRNLACTPCRHLDALRWVAKEAAVTGGGVYDVFNFGTGRGSTVFELVAAMERASGQKVPVEVGPRRSGDLTASYADPSKARGPVHGAS